MGYKPPFQNTARIVNLVADVAELVSQVTIFDGLDPNPTLRRENQIRAIHSSLLIENNALTLDQVTAVLGGHHVLAPPKDIREVQNAYEAYDVAAAFDPYSLDDLLKAHKLMMGGLSSIRDACGAKTRGSVRGTFSSIRALPATTCRRSWRIYLNGSRAPRTIRS